MSESKPTNFGALPKPRTEDEIRERFSQWYCDDRHQAYESGIRRNGGKPRTMTEQYDLYRRKFKRPDPPAGMKAKNLSEINHHEFDPSADRVPAFNY